MSTINSDRINLSTRGYFCVIIILLVKCQALSDSGRTDSTKVLSRSTLVAVQRSSKLLTPVPLGQNQSLISPPTSHAVSPVEQQQQFT